MSRWISVLAAALALEALVPLRPARAGGGEPAAIHVAADGDDAWSGRLAAPNADRSDGPLASPHAARDAVRRLRAAGAAVDEVVLHAGRYPLASPLRLEAADGGTADRPLVWRAHGVDRVILTGATIIPDLAAVDDPAVLERLPPAARGRVVRADLRTAGIADAGTFAGMGNRLEVFHADRPLPIARWPNDGFATIGTLLGDRPIDVAGLPGNAVGRFTCDTDRLPAWKNEADGWLEGYFFWDWSDSRQRIMAVDPVAKSISLEPPHTTYRSGQRFYGFNMLCELDRPGEWCVDRAAGMLFVWPPSAPQTVTVATLPHLVEIAGAAHLTLRGLLLEGTRNSLVTITGGAEVTLGGCRLRNAGGWGVVVEGGVRHAVRGCDIHDVGEGGVMLSGGDRPLLVAAGHVAENNHVHRFARVHRTYRPGVEVRGVGNRVRHNHIHHAPHNGILLGGNDHVVEGNRIHHVCQETGDVGGFYMGRDWSMRGTVVRHNLFADLSGPGHLGAMGVYLDDNASGITVVGNVFVRASRAVLIGGGRDNVVENNLFIAAAPAVEIDARGLGWAADMVAPDGIMRRRLDEMPWRTSPWTTRYPGLATILDDRPEAPRRNVIRRNLSVGGEWLRIEPAAADGVVAEANLVDVDLRFEDAARGDYRLRDDSPAWRIGFQPIPLDRIGLIADDWRPAIPEE
ncbi:MAG: right-handed parallel beta-helix repeat-containing protein [Planctomycetaceae bacterium]